MPMTKEEGAALGLAGRRLFGAEVRARRQAMGLSQGQLAARAGLDRQSVNRAENANVSPGVDKVYQLAAALGCGPGDLLPPQEPAPVRRR